MGISDIVRAPFLQKNLANPAEVPPSGCACESKCRNIPLTADRRFLNPSKLFLMIPGMQYFKRDNREKPFEPVIEADKKVPIEDPPDRFGLKLNEDKIAHNEIQTINNSANHLEPQSSPTVEISVPVPITVQPLLPMPIPEVCKVDRALQIDEIPKIDRGDSTRSNPALLAEVDVAVIIPEKPEKDKEERRKKKKRRTPRGSNVNINQECLNIIVSGPIHMALDYFNGQKLNKIVTIGGAGMSTAANIPDFRSPDSGLYGKLEKYDLPTPQSVFEKEYFDKNPKPFFALLKEVLRYDYRPTTTHYFIRLLEDKGVLLRHFTQNVDGLERMAGLANDRIVEAHGTIHVSHCTKCQAQFSLGWLRDQLLVRRHSIPYCDDKNCKGIVRPNVVLFGEPLGTQFVARSSEDIKECDLLIIMGTSLTVEPFASMIKHVPKTCPRIVINDTPVGEHLGIIYEGSKRYNRTVRKNAWRDVFIRGKCDDGVTHLARQLKWAKDLERLVGLNEKQDNVNLFMNRIEGRRHRKKHRSEIAITGEMESKQNPPGKNGGATSAYTKPGRDGESRTRTQGSATSFDYQQPKSNLSQLWRCWTSPIWR